MEFCEIFEVIFNKKSGIKITFYGENFASINNEKLVKAFLSICDILEIPTWIEEQIFDDFGILIELQPLNSNALDLALEKRFYEDKSEWLKEKIRWQIIALSEQDNNDV